jgi:hypothetical protein
MKHDEFTIGKTFWCGDREWLCTDLGSRTVIAICLDDIKVVKSSAGPEAAETAHLSRADAEAHGWFVGPPYALPETVFDEDDLPACSRDREGEARGKIAR